MAKFKARARTLDMLGRQQIAGIPTAISELFKNAHDAYADHVEVDYYRSNGLFVLRDDGLGMTKNDFEERWLTLGTESKLNTGKGLVPPPHDPVKDKRPILGEKGIGRLAIASIGPQVLVLTRAKRNNEKQDLVAALISWGLFELPGIDLDQITIPIRTFSSDKFIEINDLADMIREIKENILVLENKDEISSNDSVKLQKQLDSFLLDPREVDSYLERLSLSDGRNGTHFYIKPAYDLLQIAIDGDKNDDRASPLLKSLIGFTNTMNKQNKPCIIAQFRDHKTDEYYEELIGGNAFFLPEEFNDADHHFRGTFDEFGQFSGTVTIYGENTFNHNIYWKDGFGELTACGPFAINVAYVQGSISQTRLSAQDYITISNKLDKIGGLYIYKDGLRILPYGDSDYDFLDIEKRRTKGADYYFFSYRNMIGFIDITRDNNKNLIEKAGREGFIQNKAYRQFKSILENFFVQLAADFFRPKDKGGSIKSEFFTAKKEELKRLAKAKELAEKRATERKNKFQNDLNKFFIAVKQDQPKVDANDLLEYCKREFIIASEKHDTDESSRAFLDVESISRRKMDELRTKYKIIRPRGCALTKKMEIDWDQYLFEYAKLESNLFKTTSEMIEQMANDMILKYNILVDKRRRLQRSIQDTTDNVNNITKKEAYEAREAVKNIQSNITDLTQNILIETEDEITKVLNQFAKLDISKLDDSSLVMKRIEIEKPIMEKVEKNKELLESIKNQLKSIVTIDENGEIIPSAIDITQAYENELFTLREREDIDLELAQLGMAINIVQHEFTGTIKSINKNIKTLKAWADVNQELYPLYNNIRINFEHLDGYLTLFTPLYRRLNRTKSDITGLFIKDFIDDLFSERIRRHGIIIESSKTFNKKIINGYPSTFLPVFVNIIDNAIFWLKDRQYVKKILLDADDGGITISNNGPEIPFADREIIFEMGFTRKPNGRGLGLFISKQVLKKEGYNISVIDPIPNMAVTFRIEPCNNELIKEGNVI